MKKLLLYLLAVMMTFAVSCEKFDDSAIWEKLNSFENTQNSFESRLAALELLCSQMNTNISSLQQVVEVLQNNDYVTNIAPITEDGKTIGYTITFSKSGSITIYHGKDGKDGSTPVIGVKKYNSTYYWTLNGEWLLDSNGKKIKAEGRDGKNGQNGIDGTNGSNGTNGTNGTNGNDGITPKLKIENEYWYVSYDNGSTWTQVGKATSESSNNNDIIDDVTYDDDCVYIKLADGTELNVPRYITTQIFYTATAKVEPDLDNYEMNVVSHEWDSTTGEGVITIKGEAIKTIPGYSFINCGALTGITIPNTVISIGDMAFAYCTSLESITIPNNVTSIGGQAFDGCTSLKNITLPEGITTLNSTFGNCTSLENITIPNSVLRIETGTFSYCKSLKNITIPENVTFIGDEVFDGCTLLESITIPDSVEEIGGRTFAECSLLKTITIPKSVTVISDSLFKDCTSLESVTIPDGVIEIGSYVFQRCTSLKNITIPDTVESIGWAAFSGCSSLASVYCKPTTPPSIESDTFENTASEMKIYVPATAVDDYKTATYWSNYASVIEEIQ